MSRLKSIIWTISNIELLEIIKYSQSYSDVLRSLNLKTSGGNTTTLKERIKQEEIDVSHFSIYILGNRENRTEQSVEYVFVENSTYKNNVGLKNKIIKYNLLEYKCIECGNKGEWNGKKLILQVHHKNGKHDDHRIENLEFLCPNCHTQTDNFTGGNARKPTEETYTYRINQEKVKINKLKEENKLKKIQEELDYKDNKEKLITSKNNNEETEIREIIKNYPLNKHGSIMNLSRCIGISHTSVKRRLKKYNIQ